MGIQDNLDYRMLLVQRTASSASPTSNHDLARLLAYKIEVAWTCLRAFYNSTYLETAVYPAKTYRQIKGFLQGNPNLESMDCTFIL